MPILDERHDHPHAVGDDDAWNESWYFNAYAPAADAGFVSRLGWRPNAGRAHSLLVVWLPGGAVQQMHADRSTTSIPDGALEGGGVRFECLEPLRAWRVSAGVTTPRGRRVALEATFRALTAAIGVDMPASAANDAARAASVGSLASGHLEQAGRWSGWIEVDGACVSIEGRGNRDKSWGPRKIDGSRGLTMWRWFSVNVGDDFHVGGLRMGTAAGDLHRGWIWRGGEATSVRHWNVRTETAADRLTPRRLELTVTDKHGMIERLHGEVLRVVPLELPDAGGMLVLESLTRWTRDGAEGSGIAEYAHLLDAAGRPTVAVE